MPKQVLNAENELRPLLLAGIQEHLEQKGISHRDLAKRLGVTRENVVMLLDGRRAMPLAILLNIVEALGGMVSIQVAFNQPNNRVCIYTTTKK